MQIILTFPSQIFFFFNWFTKGGEKDPKMSMVISQIEALRMKVVGPSGFIQPDLPNPNALQDMLLNSNEANIGMKAHDFYLLNVNNKFYTLKNIRRKNGFVIAFICNHCPYVKDIISRLVNDFNYLLSIDIGVLFRRY